MTTTEIVTYDPEDLATYPSVCVSPEEVKRRFELTGGERLLFDSKGNYIGQIVKELSHAD